MSTLPVVVKAQTQTSSGNVNISAAVPGPPPATPPTIDLPTNGQTFSEKNISINGTCISSLLVRVFSNDIFIGSTTCQNDGTYSLMADLFVDRNDLIARQYDSLNQPGPDSLAVTVYYLQPTLNLPDEQASALEKVARFQLVIDYDYTSHGVFVNQPFRLPVHFIGGSAPYTVAVDWGDGSSNSFIRQNTEQFTAEYAYQRPGSYVVIIKVADSSKQSAYLQFVVLVHGQTDSPIARWFFGQAENGAWTPASTAAAISVFTGGAAIGLFAPAIVSLVKRIVLFIAKLLINIK